MLRGERRQRHDEPPVNKQQESIIRNTFEHNAVNGHNDTTTRTRVARARVSRPSCVVCARACTGSLCTLCSLPAHIYAASFRATYRVTFFFPSARCQPAITRASNCRRLIQVRSSRPVSSGLIAPPFNEDSKTTGPRAPVVKNISLRVSWHVSSTTASSLAITRTYTLLAGFSIKRRRSFHCDSSIYDSLHGQPLYLSYASDENSLEHFVFNVQWTKLD